MSSGNPSRDRKIDSSACLSGSRTEQTIEVVKRNWRAEVETAQTYRDLAGRERDEKTQRRSSCAWPKRKSAMRSAGRKAPRPRRRAACSEQTRSGAGSIVGGTKSPEPRSPFAEWKRRKNGTKREFHEQAERALAGEQDVQEFLRQSALEEKAHARALSAMAPPVSPRTALDKILKRERWHGRGGSWVADAIYGANDGLGAVFGIVSGVAGATNNQQHYILDLRSCWHACFHSLDGRRRVSRGKE